MKPTYKRLAEKVEEVIAALSADQTPVITLECSIDGEIDLNGLRVEAVQNAALAEYLAAHPEHSGAAFVYVTRTL
jgi:hypothetical protein